MLQSNTFGLLNYDKMVANQEERNKQKYQKNLDEQLADLDEIIEDAQNKLNAKSLVVPNPTTENNGNNNNDDNDWGLDDANQKWRLENDAAFLAKKVNSAKNTPPAKSQQSKHIMTNYSLSRFHLSKIAWRQTKNREKIVPNSKFNLPTNSSSRKNENSNRLTPLFS